MNRMYTFTKKGIAVLLSTIMLLGVFPLSALADEIGETSPATEQPAAVQTEQNTAAQAEQNNETAPAAKESDVVMPEAEQEQPATTEETVPSEEANKPEEAVTTEETQAPEEAATAEETQKQEETATTEETQKQEETATTEEAQNTEAESSETPAAADPAETPAANAPAETTETAAAEPEADPLPPADAEIKVGQAAEYAFTANDSTYTIRLTVLYPCKLRLTYSYAGVITILMQNEQDGSEKLFDGENVEDSAWKTLEASLVAAAGTYFITVTAAKELQPEDVYPFSIQFDYDVEKPSEQEQDEEAVTEPEKVEEDATEPEQVEELAAEPEKVEENTTEPEQTEEPVSEPEKAEEPTTEPGKSEEPAAEPEQVEENTTEPEQTEEPVSEPEKAEEPTTEPGKSEEPAAEPEKIEEPAIEPEKIEEPAAEPKKANAAMLGQSAPASEPDYTFPQAEVLLKDVLSACGYSIDNFINNTAVSVTPSDAVTLSETSLKNKNRDSLTLTASAYFETATLIVGSIVITLSWPEPSEIPGDEPIETPDPTPSEEPTETPTSAPTYTFPQAEVLLKDVLSACGYSIDNFINNTAVSVTPSDAVTLSETRLKNKNRESLTLTASAYFETATLTVGSVVITLSWPEPTPVEPTYDAEYTFADEDDYIMLLSLLTERDIYTKAIDDAAVTDGDASAVELQDYIGDYMIVPTANFETVVLTLTAREGGVYTVALHFPAEPLTDYTVEAPLRPEVPADAIWANDVLYLTGKMPGNAVVVVEPVEKDGIEGVLSYDIKIYANENQRAKGKTWQPAGEKVQVHFFHETFGNDEIAVFHWPDGATEAEYVGTVTAADGWVDFEAESFSAYSFLNLITDTLQSWKEKLYTLAIKGYTFLNPNYKDVETVTLEEGLELVKACTITYSNSVKQLLTSLLNRITNNLSMTFENLGLTSTERDSIVVYALEDGKLGKVLAENPESNAEIKLGDAEGFVVVRDNGYRHLNFALGHVTIDGMMPKAATAAAENETEATEQTLSEQLTENDAVLAAYNISIKEGEAAYQPDEEHPVSVEIADEGITADGSYAVLHIHDDGTVEEVQDFTVENGKVSFAASGFSVYVIIDHEGGNVVTPRVEFHFIDRLSDEAYISGASSPFTSGPYNFVNTAGEYQTTQIIKDGETLQRINDPRNVVITSAGNNIEKYFYGWYVVDKTTDDTSLNSSTGKYNGTIKYTWQKDEQISFEDSISITLADTDGNAGYTIGDELTWELGGVTGTGIIDDNGSVHVYLAPLFQDFYFINFRMGVRNSVLATNLLTRKLVVFGERNSVDVRIGNVECPSSDPSHQIFVGWETVTDTGSGNLARKEFYQTLDGDNNEINNPASGTGYYVTVQKNGSDVTQLDLYPVFAEARWMNFDRGVTGNGSTYVGSAYRLTNDEGEGTYFDNDFFNGANGNVTHLSSRTGYDLEGWYAFAVTDTDGNITNLQNPANVTISYVDKDGTKKDVTVNTTAIKIVNVDNSGTTPVGSITYTGAYNLDTGSGSEKLFDVVNGKLYVYRALDSLKLQANWVVNDNTTIRVIVWKQKVSDDKNTTKTPVDLQNWLKEDLTRKAADYPYTVKEYDYEIFYLANQSTASKPDLTQFTGTYRDTTNNTQTYSGDLTNLSYTGFHYSADDVDVVGAPNPDGTSVYNVYYDRNVHRLTFQVDDNNNGYNYTVTTADTAPQYAFINGQFVELTYTNGTWYAPKFGYTYTENDGIGTFGKVGEKYYELTRHVGSYTYNRTGYTYTRTTNNSGTQYGIVEGKIAQIYYRNWNWRLTDDRNGRIYNGYRYSRSNPSTAAVYTGDLYTLINETAGQGQSGFETTASVTGDNLFGRDGNNNTYFQLRVTENNVTYTYVDDNGVTQSYEGEHRFVRNYTQTEEKEEFFGTRYTQSAYTNSWYTVYIIEALYGQSIAKYFPIPGYDNGERWAPQTNNQGWSQVMIIVEAMPDEDVAFHLDTATRPLKTMNYYVEVIPGEAGSTTYNGIQFKLHGEPVNARYNGVTPEDYIEITGFERYQWQSGSSSGTFSTGIDNNGFYIYDANNPQTINFYYLRNQSDFTFDVNYPMDAALTYSNGESTNLVIDEIYYEASLAEYATRYGVDSDSVQYEKDLTGPDHYIFGGWYEDKSCTVPFNFNSTMPVGNKIVYAKWTPETFWVKVDPNGGEINRINSSRGYTSYGAGFELMTPTYLTFDGYEGDKAINSSGQATYIDADYGETITEYTIPRRFVAMTDAAADQYEADGGTTYYYINTQLRNTDGISGLYTHLRSALYLTETEIEHYYNLYVAIIDYSLNPATTPNATEVNAGMTKLDFDTWKQIYVSKNRYRPLYANEHWTFLGWYKVVNGVMDSMPYNFSDPVTEAFTLRAMWRLDGGYQIQYIPEYTMPNGDVINGTMTAWLDPDSSSGLLYSDDAKTNIFKAPTELKKNGSLVQDDSVIFEGFRLVYNDGTADAPVWKPMEADSSGNVTTLYYPSDPYVVSAANADADGKIYLQAVYSDKGSSNRRPDITNLILDANTGYVNTSNSEELPEWNFYPGTSAINTADHIVSGNPTQILFGDIQASADVHLYKYATEAGVIAPDGQQFFTHPDGYFLLGFDEYPTEGDYAATYAADSVIAVERQPINAAPQTLYGVWEPMVYVTFVNNTGVDMNDVTFGLSSNDVANLQVINVRNGLYDRTPLSDYGNITLKNGESISLAFPYGAEHQLTVSGTNNLGVGKVLIWNSSIELVNENSTTTTYTTVGSTTPDVVYTHQDHSHTLVSGEVFNTKDFSFNETMIVNEKPLTVTFTSRNNEYALLLDDNYTGGGVQEFDYGVAEIKPEGGVNKTQKLPTTSTRIGYSFVGWAYDKNATTPDFSASYPAGNPWTILNLDNENGGFFSENLVEIDGVYTRTLYAVWEARTDAVYVYKDVSEPGNKSQEFDFTLAITGRYQYGYYSDEINESKTFTLKHGEYAKISSSQDNATQTGHNTAMLVSNVEVYRVANNPDGTTSYVKDDDRSIEIRWTKDMTGNTSSTRSFAGLKLAVTEGAVTHYETSVTLNSQTNNGELTLGNSSTYNSSLLPKTENTNTFSWTNTDAGGSVVFTNQRQTYDVEVSKELTSNTSANVMFSFTASYEDNGVTTPLDPFTVFSGGTKMLEKIPAGATLTITEVTDENNNYDTKYSLDNRANYTSGKEASFAVTEDKVILFDNTLKSYPVTFKLVDQDGNPTINGMFSLDSSIGSLGTELYASSSSTNPPAGVFYQNDEFWADTYTLTQTIIPTNYIGLKNSVTLTVTGKYGIVSSDPDNVKVTWLDGSDHTKGYLVTVYNRATKKITVNKILNDPLLSSTRAFNFSYSYTPQGETTPVTGNFMLQPAANNPTGVSYDLVVPIYSNVTITELTTGDNEVIGKTYDTTVTAEGLEDSNTEDVAVFTNTRVEADGTVTFTNTRKEVKVTVNKEVVDSTETTAFSFTATIKNGESVLTTYGEEGASVNGFVKGVQTFTLAHGESLTLTIPYGVTIEVVETPVDNFVTTVDGLKTNSYTGEVKADTQVSFVNTKVADLTITKEVTGLFGDRTKAFTFTITGAFTETSYGFTKHTSTDGTNWMESESGTYNVSDGNIRFTLKHNERIVIKDLPLNVQLTVSETNNDDYTTTWKKSGESDQTGSSYQVTLTVNAELIVQNNLPALAPTNVRTVIVPFAVMLGFGIAIAMIFWVGKRRREHV